jgi:lipid-A-disaccharide synthase
MKYYLVVGEASGDLHASNLMKALKELDDSAEFRFWGGARMESVGGTLVKHYHDISFMGFWEIVKNARKLRRYLLQCRHDILSWRPDVLIPVDFPGFNLRMSRFASRVGIPVCYYISPQVWAWQSSRVKSIRRHVKRMITILPFERGFYERYGFKADYVGHPLLDVIPNSTPAERPGNTIAVLPGSRLQEVETSLPILVSVADEFPGYRFIICGVGSIDRSIYERIVGTKGIELVYDQTHATLGTARAALVTSGTATLEAALLNVPQVVCYKTEAVSYFIGRRLVKVDFIALVNLIMGREVVRELIQRSFTKANVCAALSELLDEENRRRILDSYGSMREKLGGPGASGKAAAIVHEVAVSGAGGAGRAVS